MMENRRWQKADNYSQDGSRRRSQHKKPPRGNWQPSVPSWEKAFCKVIGSLDWKTFVDLKKYVYLYDNIINWDDSAGEEAFMSAKNRFRAKLHGMPCNDDLPDPDLYIDEVDWESKIDPDLLSDLECRYEVPDGAEKTEPVIIFGDSLVTEYKFAGVGWGESVEKEPANLNSNNRGNLLESYENSNVAGDYHCNTSPFKGDGPWTNAGWGVGWDTSDAVNHNYNHNKVESEGVRNKNVGWYTSDAVNHNNYHSKVEREGVRNKNVGWDTSDAVNHNYYHSNVEREGAKNKNGTGDAVTRSWDVDNWNRGRAGMSRYKVSRFHGEGHNSDHSRRNRNAMKRETAAWDHTNTGRRPPSTGWINACGPATHHHASNKAGQNWGWEKSVS